MSIIKKLSLTFAAIILSMTFAVQSAYAANVVINLGHGNTEGSAYDPLAKKFAELAEKIASKTTPSWIKFDLKKNIAEIQGMPKMENEELLFNLGSVIEFYSR